MPANVAVAATMVLVGSNGVPSGGQQSGSEQVKL
jgi:hypothetical protein